ncbi:unnamed protein product [Mortierella alpina]
MQQSRGRGLSQESSSNNTGEDDVENDERAAQADQVDLAITAHRQWASDPAQEPPPSQSLHPQMLSSSDPQRYASALYRQFSDNRHRSQYPQQQQQQQQQQQLSYTPPHEYYSNQHYSHHPQHHEEHQRHAQFYPSQQHPTPLQDRRLGSAYPWQQDQMSSHPVHAAATPYTQGRAIEEQHRYQQSQQYQNYQQQHQGHQSRHHQHQPLQQYEGQHQPWENEDSQGAQGRLQRGSSLHDAHDVFVPIQQGQPLAGHEWPSTRQLQPILAAPVQSVPSPSSLAAPHSSLQSHAPPYSLSSYSASLSSSSSPTLPLSSATLASTASSHFSSQLSQTSYAGNRLLASHSLPTLLSFSAPSNTTPASSGQSFQRPEPISRRKRGRSSYSAVLGSSARDRSEETSAPFSTAGHYTPQFLTSPSRPAPNSGVGQVHGASTFSAHQVSSERPQHGYPAHPANDSKPTAPRRRDSSPKEDASNKRPLVLSPDVVMYSEQFLEPRRQREALARRDSLPLQHQDQQQQRFFPHDMQQPEAAQISSALTSITSSKSMLPMPHFRTQLRQHSGDSNYQRRFYSSSPSTSSSKLPTSQPTLSSSPSPSPASSVHRGTAARRQHSSSPVASSPDASVAVNTQLGRLLISTKQHVSDLLESFIFPKDDRDVKGMNPNLEGVLVDLLNGMLQSHDAFATRDNLSSQEQPMSFRPTVIASLAQFRDLLSHSSHPRHPASSFASTAKTMTEASSPLIVAGQRQHSLLSSRYSSTFLEVMDVESDTERYRDASGAPGLPDNESHVQGQQTTDGNESIEMYKSTVEFLALMTAFVSVVCWLMQTRLGDADTSKPNLQSEAGIQVQARLAGMTDIDMGGPDGGRQKSDNTHGSITLSAFLDLFSDRDNVLKPIRDAITRSIPRRTTEYIHSESGGPDQEVGLFAWHYLLFGSNHDGPLQMDGSSIDADAMRSVHFDVLLNELYTTHVLSMTVKEHQKDHGQFYTPPGIVDFMWKRTLREGEDLLGTLMAVSSSTEEGKDPRRDYTTEHLIPSALDPCLGVSTFLSCYIRLLIQEAQKGSAMEAIWNSELGSKLLLCQICEHVWGIELDGFAFWMARCGILAALMPLVQRVQELSRDGDSSALQGERLRPLSKLPRLHLFRSDTLQLVVPKGNTPEIEWERQCILKLRDPKRLQFDYIVTNPPYMIRKTGTFSTPDAEVFDWTTLDSIIALDEGAAIVNDISTTAGVRTKRRTRKAALRPSSGVEGEEIMDVAVNIDDEEAGNESDAEIGLSESGTSTPSATSRSGRVFPPMRPGAKGMMQAYGYFIWFGAQRIKPHYGVVCMITASQWLTLEFAARIRAWLFNHCLMEEFFQFEPFKVFSKVQTDSLIFKIRALGSQQPDTAQAHRTVFLRHMDHHKPLAGILQDYLDFLAAGSSAPSQSELSLNIMVSSKTRAELQAAILREITLPQTVGSSASSASASNALPLTYSFAPMMPSSELTTHLLALTRDLGGICSAGTKRINRLSAAEPLLWHRGPNTNPVYGLVVRMEYARSEFGEVMSQRWFRPAFYWNGKNSPEGASAAAAIASGSKAIHKEGAFWQGRDRLRLSKKEGSPAESYLVSVPDVQRTYGLCMVDKEAVKVLREQVEQGVEGSHALWNYLTDVRSHFQPGLAMKKRKTAGASGKQPSVDDDGVAFCSTNQCGFDVPEKIIHPINYGYFSKTQPRQRFFLDTSSLAVTNQCIYLTLNRMSHHYNEQQSPPLLYFLTLLNSSTLQFFVLHHCQYDQQGRMRLFRDSMAKIPFQDRDVKHHPEKTRYAAHLGELMISLKEALYRLVSNWQLTSSQHGFGRAAAAESTDGALNQPAANSGFFSGSQGLLDWVRRGGDAPAGVLMRTRQQIQRMLLSVSAQTQPCADTDMESVAIADTERGMLLGTAGSLSVGSSYQDPRSPTLVSQTVVERMARECDTIMQAIERAIEMVEGLQWAVDQYGYMLYGILPKFQKLLEMELKVVYSSRLESWIVPTSPSAQSSSAAFASPTSTVATATSLGQSLTDSVEPDDTFIRLQRWDGDTSAAGNDAGSAGSIPVYAQPLLARAQSSIQTLHNLLQAYPSFSQ